MGIFSKKKNPEVVSEDAQAVAPAVALPSGGDATAYGVIQGPHVTEKSSLGAALRKYVFKIHPASDKISVRASIQKLYKVSVKSVHISRVPSKMRQVGKHKGVKSGYKKAIVTLVPGDKIDIV